MGSFMRSGRAIFTIIYVILMPLSYRNLLRSKTAEKGIKSGGCWLNRQPRNLALYPSSGALVQSCNEEVGRSKGESSLCLSDWTSLGLQTTIVISISYSYTELYSAQRASHVCVCVCVYIFMCRYVCVCVYIHPSFNPHKNNENCGKQCSLFLFVQIRKVGLKEIKWFVQSQGGSNG